MEPGARAGRLGLVALVAAIGTVVTVSAVRVATIGLQPIAPDDVAYIGVGRALWRFHEPLGIDGAVFTIRSWVYPLMLGGASRLFEGGVFGGDAFTGARILGWLFGTTALVLGIVFAYRLARAPAAVATALVLLLTPMLWEVVPSSRIDVALMFFTVLVLLVVDTPTPGRMLAGGILAGVTMLVKETSVLFLLFPLAYLGTLPRPEWTRLALRYGIGFAVTVGWWFVTVLILKGEIFPLEGFTIAAGREVPREWSLGATGTVLVLLFAAAWLVVGIGRRAEPRARLLLLALVAFVPATVIAWVKELALRQFAPVVLLSCIALGVAVVDVVRAGVARVPARNARRVTVVVVVVLLVVVAVPVFLTQDRTTVTAAAGDIDEDVATWVAARPGEPTVVSTFRYKAHVWALSDLDQGVRPLLFENPVTPPELGPAVWVDHRQGRYHVLPRAELAKRVDGADYLLLTGPHRLGPIALATWLNQHGAALGIEPVARFGARDGTTWAYAYRLDDPQVERIPTIVSTTAAELMVADDAFAPEGPTVIAGTRGGFIRLGREIPIDDYEQLEAPLR